MEKNGEPTIQVLRNNPTDSPLTETSTNPTGIVTVSDKVSGRLLYKIRPGSETSVAFGNLDGGEITVKITDRYIQIGRNSIENNRFEGAMAGVVVHPDGGIRIGAAIPSQVLQWLT